jgi:hypothetical protein
MLQLQNRPTQTETLNANPEAPNTFKDLELATQNIIAHAKFLEQQKELLPRSDYKQLLKSHGWKQEEKKYLRVATAFTDFTPEQLAAIEPSTIFYLANNRKKYQPVIDELKNLTQITQETVRALIEKHRSVKPKQESEEKPTIWKIGRDGKRYCQIPAIYDEEVGVAIQRMMEKEGKTAQSIVSEGISLREAFTQGRLIFIDPPSENSTSESKQHDEETTHEAVTEVVEQRADVPQDEPTIEVVEQSDDTPQDEPTTEVVEQRADIPQDEPAIEVVNERGDVLQDESTIPKDIHRIYELAVEEVQSQWACGEEEYTSNSGEWTFEVENSDDDLEDEPVIANCADEVPTPVEILIETFQTATSWADIRDMLKKHDKHKQEAWEALTPLEKKRVMAMMPDGVRKLSEAKKAGVVEEFKEVGEGLYQVKLAGSLFFEAVSNGQLDKFLGD